MLETLRELDPFGDSGSFQDQELAAWQAQLDRNRRGFAPEDLNIVAGPGEFNLELTKGYIAIVNEFHRPKITFTDGKRKGQLFKYSAHVKNGRVYAVRSYRVRGDPMKKQVFRYLSQDLMAGEFPALPEGIEEDEDLRITIDHANGNGLDNRWINLTPTTATLNNFNVPVRGDCEYRGVSWTGNPRRGWEGRFKKKFIGYFRTAEQAARKYDEKLIEYVSKIPNLRSAFVHSLLNLPAEHMDVILRLKQTEETRFAELTRQSIMMQQHRIASEDVPF